MTSDTLLGWTYFLFFAIFALVGAVVTITNANPIRGALGLLAMIVSIAGLYLSLHAEFLAAIQLIVYAGAVVVLFLFVIMLLGPRSQSPADEKGRMPRALSAGLFVLLGTAVGATFLTLARTIGAQTAKMHAQNGYVPATLPSDFGGIDAFGKELFTGGLVPFELSSALLLVAVVGAIAVARGKQVDPDKTPSAKEEPSA